MIQIPVFRSQGQLCRMDSASKYLMNVIVMVRAWDVVFSDQSLDALTRTAYFNGNNTWPVFDVYLKKNPNKDNDKGVVWSI